MALYAFDGTWNDSTTPDDRKDTNVHRFRVKYAREVEYKDGVGTRYGFIGKVFGGAMGVGAGARIAEQITERRLLQTYVGAKERALMNGRFYVTCEDVETLAAPVLRHRLLTNFNAETEGKTTDFIIDRLLKETPKHEEV